MNNTIFGILLGVMVTFALMVLFNPSAGPVAVHSDKQADHGSLAELSGELNEQKSQRGTDGHDTVHCAATPNYTSTASDEAPFGAGLNSLQTPKQHKAMLKGCSNPKRRTRVRPVEKLDSFIERIFDSLDHAVVGRRPIEHIVANFEKLWAQHGGIERGFWAEFGVFRGNSLKMASDHLMQINNDTGKRPFKGVMAGFDSWEGLPVKWRTNFQAGLFSSDSENLYDVVREMVHPDVELYKGWFQNTIGTFMEKHRNMPAAFIHHDGDLFVSTAITFSFLAPRIVPGTIMCFDELHGYHGFEQHEILSLFLWMQEYDVEVCSIAVHSPLRGTLRVPRAPVMRKKATGEKKQKDFDEYTPFQSACFQVMSLRTPRHRRRPELQSPNSRATKGQPARAIVKKEPKVAQQNDTSQDEQH